MPPKGSKWSKKKFDKCVADMKKKPGIDNPYAVCTAISKGTVKRGGKKK